MCLHCRDWCSGCVKFLLPNNKGLRVHNCIHGSEPLTREYSPIKKFHAFYGTKRFVTTGRPLVPILSQINSVQTLTAVSLRSISVVPPTYAYCYQVLCFLKVFWLKFWMHFSSLSAVLLMLYLIWSPYNIWWAHIHKLLMIHVSPSFWF
jgi:hypothetical protein